MKHVAVQMSCCPSIYFSGSIGRDLSRWWPGPQRQAAAAFRYHLSQGTGVSLHSGRWDSARHTPSSDSASVFVR